MSHTFDALLDLFVVVFCVLAATLSVAAVTGVSLVEEAVLGCAVEVARAVAVAVNAHRSRRRGDER
jgi:hypothetical protein